MVSNPINQIKEIGQSVWYDDLSRELILSGSLEKLVQRGITGVTSNPVSYTHLTLPTILLV